ncbi:MAG: hypothetical protein COT26_02500 [Candidatus Kerfeldbacteria bacterium CG08_land_8_20_14_0_20_43_14]|uniref:Uncharacterized protein n=1 Tax=Candidatus Kerfeldbacteria bacterium CG08_land_8_20_14_0_20_43_14 TaxID=2014246 RepID=A0A2H0YQ99_9BACT|nr:MAG: hypothetical protein COT26_02500 [Candidatus Kerfeldbacteria bacterium CG08_land_8_20_14_0_20_43_14]
MPDICCRNFSGRTKCFFTCHPFWFMVYSLVIFEFLKIQFSFRLLNKVFAKEVLFLRFLPFS